MAKTLIEEFYEKNSQYHFLSLKEFNTICKAPFEYVKECFHKAENVRLKYLGNFSVVESRKKKMIIDFDTRLEKGSITKEQYNEKLKNIINNENEI